ncbi:MAG: hypothetical protein ACI4DK_12675, partial [Lachnospiraceae bacterium]
MLKRFLCIFISLSIFCSVLVLSASATPFNVPNDFSRFLSDIWEISEQYDSGEISKSDFIDKFKSSMIRFDINFAGDVTYFKDVLSVMEFCGIDVPCDWQEWYYENKMGGDGSGGNRDDSILNGYGAVVISTVNSTGKTEYTYYGDYGIFNNTTKSAYIFNCNAVYPDGRVIYYDSICFAYYDSFPSDGYRTFTVYGDFRYDDGSSADDFITELPEKEIPTYDDESISDDDIMDFLKDLLENLMLQFPDLTNVEGLLRAILAQLSNLDSDDDADALSAVNAAIVSLASDSHSDNQAIISVLSELKESLKSGEGSDVSKICEQLEGLQKSLDYLCTVNTLDFGLDLWDELTENEEKFLDEYSTLILTLLPKFGLSTVNNMIMNMNSV